MGLVFAMKTVRKEGVPRRADLQAPFLDRERIRCGKFVTNRICLDTPLVFLRAKWPVVDAPLERGVLGVRCIFHFTKQVIC